MDFPGGSDGKESSCDAGDPGLILGWRKSPGEGKGYPLQYFMDSMKFHGVSKSCTQLSDFHLLFYICDFISAE